jgi:hypothetical protein
MSFRTGPRARDVIPNRAEGPVRNLLFARAETARVERTLLSAAFDFAFVSELKAHAPPAQPWKSGA